MGKHLLAFAQLVPVAGKVELVPVGDTGIWARWSHFAISTPVVFSPVPTLYVLSVSLDTSSTLFDIFNVSSPPDDQLKTLKTPGRRGKKANLRPQLSPHSRPGGAGRSHSFHRRLARRQQKQQKRVNEEDKSQRSCSCDGKLSCQSCCGRTVARREVGQGGNSQVRHNHN